MNPSAWFDNAHHESLGVKCELCGATFEKSESACEKCIFHAKDCNMVKCPNCGYKFVEDTKITNWLRNIFKIKGEK